MAIVILISLIIFSPILFGYYLDFKNNPKEFNFEFSNIKNGITKILLFFLIYFGINKIYDFVFPLEKKNGFEFNTEREKIGLPKLEGNWKMDKSESNRQTIIWWKPNPYVGHFKKVIEYGILNPENETDYYKSKNNEKFLWSVYSYENETFEYYVEKPNEKAISVTEKGNLKYENPTIEIKISKTEFENYIKK